MPPLVLALLGGLAMRYAFGLDPVWWLAWIAPAPVLVAALRSEARRASLLVLLAGLVATSGKTPYFAIVMPLPFALLVTVLLALTWVLVIGVARTVMLRSAGRWTVLAYPVPWCALDTVLAALHPDGNWGSLAYSQAGMLPAVQAASLTGVAGIVFALSLVPAAIAYAVQHGLRDARLPLAGAAALTFALFAFGFARIPAQPAAAGTLVGLAVVDDFIGPRLPAALTERVWSQYERHVAALAEQGARIVLLPEKISTVGPDEAARLSQRMSALAARTGVWLALGIGVDDGHRKRNLEWLFDPTGRLDASYDKHHMAPPERDFSPGADYAVRAIDGTRYGLAICKDMHFAEMGRAYGQRNAQAMLVPAWDFGPDGVYAARQSALRGIESGFAMVRASREGLLTVTDAYGRVVAETHSATLPGATLLARVPVGHVTTLYSRFGDWFAWPCTAAALPLLWIGIRHRRAGARTGLFDYTV